MKTFVKNRYCEERFMRRGNLIFLFFSL